MDTAIKLVQWHHYILVVPFLLIILPLSTALLVKRVIAAKPEKRRDLLYSSLKIFLFSTLITHIFFKTKGVADWFSAHSWEYIVLAIIQTLFYLLIPILPFLVGRKLLSQYKKNPLYIFTLSYGLFFGVELLLFIYTVLTDPVLPGIIVSRPSVILILVNFPQTMDFFQSTVLHSFFHLLL